MTDYYSQFQRHNLPQQLIIKSFPELKNTDMKFQCVLYFTFPSTSAEIIFQSTVGVINDKVIILKEWNDALL